MDSKDGMTTITRVIGSNKMVSAVYESSYCCYGCNYDCNYVLGTATTTAAKYRRKTNWYPTKPTRPFDVIQGVYPAIWQWVGGGLLIFRLG